MQKWRSISVIGAAAFVVGCDDGLATTASQVDPQVQILAMDAVSVAGSQGTYTTRHDGAEVRIGFPVPAERVNPTYFHFAERIGATGDVAVVLDTYGSGAGGGERCATERESWVRAFSLAERRQVGAVLVASCLDRIAAGDPPVVWRGDGFRTTGPTPRAFRVDARGITPQS